MLKITDLTFSYEEKKVFENLNLEIPLEGLTALTGPSGCGKTTLLRIIAGLEMPDQGFVKGADPKKCAILFQEDRLLPWRTVGEHLTDVLSDGEMPAPKPFSKDMSREGSIEEWLTFAELEGERDTYPDKLSGGMARRLSLARCCVFCLSQKDELFLLDEPFTGIDANRRKRILERISSLHVPAILATHEQDVVEMCTHVISLDL